MPPNAYFLTKFGTDTSAPRWPFGLNLLAFCLNSGFFVWRSGPPAAGVGLRENCHLGAFFFPRASLFSAFLRTLALSSRALLFAVVIFWLAVLFHVRFRAGPARAGSAPGSPLCSSLPCVPWAAQGCRGCMSAGLGGAYFLSSFRCMLVVPRANHPFQHVFGFSRRRRESVCVCVCVCVCVYVCVCVCVVCVCVINSLSCLNEKKWKKIWKKI